MAAIAPSAHEEDRWHTYPGGRLGRQRLPAWRMRPATESEDGTDAHWRIERYPCGTSDPRWVSWDPVLFLPADLDTTRRMREVLDGRGPVETIDPWDGLCADPRYGSWPLATRMDQSPGGFLRVWTRKGKRIRATGLLIPPGIAFGMIERMREAYLRDHDAPTLPIREQTETSMDRTLFGTRQLVG